MLIKPSLTSVGVANGVPVCVIHLNLNQRGFQGSKTFADKISNGRRHLIKGIQTASKNQTLVHQAVLVCALERFRKAEGWDPEKLETLAPRFLGKVPLDVISGQPLKYQRRGDGSRISYRRKAVICGGSLDIEWNAFDGERSQCRFRHHHFASHPTLEREPPRQITHCPLLGLLIWKPDDDHERSVCPAAGTCKPRPGDLGN